MIKDVEKLIVSFLVQDFRCRKTNEISKVYSSFLSDSCQHLGMDKESIEAHKQLHELLQVARGQNMPTLLQIIGECL